MASQWDNLFWQLPSSDSATQRERNTTKNLLKLLEDTNSTVERRFVDLLRQATGSEDQPEVESVEYEREYSGTPDSDVEAVFLVGISRKGKSFSPEELAGVEAEGGQPDGALVVETESGKFQYILEVKTGKGTLGKTQIGKYCNKFDVDPQNVSSVQWSTIYSLGQELESELSHELSSYLVTEFAEYLHLQNLDRKIALFQHSGYEKSIGIEPSEDGVVVTFHAEESGSSDTKQLSGEQFRELFTEFFDELGLDQESRREIFVEGEQQLLSDAIQAHTGGEVAATDVGFSEKARYRLVIDDHGEDAGLLKLQEMRRDGRSAEFPNTYHFMLTEWELLQVISPDQGPGFTTGTLDNLFVQLRPDKAL